MISLPSHAACPAGRLLVPLLVLACLAAPAAAFQIALDAPRERNGYVWTDVRLSSVFAPRVRESLSRGMPATLQLHAEMWRHRNGWFDRLESSFEASIRIRLEVWNESFRMERAGAPAAVVASLDSVERALSRPISLPVGRVGPMKPDSRYYVVVSATLKPLTVEDVAEVEGWLSGEVQDKRRSRLGVITGLPGAVFDAVRNFAGFGDQRVRAISSEFDLRSLFER